jgi:hypothetical protein
VLVLLIVALAVLWAQPWDDDGDAGTPNVPAIGDDSGGGGAGAGDGGSGDGGSGDGGSSGGDSSGSGGTSGQ